MWRHVDKSDQCWLWTAATFANGYGAFRLGGRSGRTAYTHRLAWELTNGPIPDGVEVCHSCDVRACVNPAHLFLGTHAENMRDMADKGRAKTSNAKGEAHPLARLTAADIAAIRERYAAGGVLQRELATEYGVGQVHISRVVRGLSWVYHVSSP